MSKIMMVERLRVSFLLLALTLVCCTMVSTVQAEEQTSQNAIQSDSDPMAAILDALRNANLTSDNLTDALLTRLVPRLDAGIRDRIINFTKSDDFASMMLYIANLTGTFQNLTRNNLTEALLASIATQLDSRIRAAITNFTKSDGFANMKLYISKLAETLQIPTGDMIGMVARVRELSFQDVVKAVLQVGNVKIADPFVNVTKKCRTDFNHVLEDSSAVFVLFDAMGKPPTGVAQGNTHWVGAYDQCKDFTAQRNITDDTYGLWSMKKLFKGQYCEAKFDLQAGSQTTEIWWGLCVPDSCTGEDIKTFLNKGPLSFSIKSAQCEIDHDKLDIKQDGLAISCIVVLVLLAATIVTCTIYDGMCLQEANASTGSFEKQATGSKYLSKGESQIQLVSVTTESKESLNGDVTYDEKTINNNNESNFKNGSANHIIEGETNFDVPKAKKSKEGVLAKFVRAFSIYHNMPKLFGTTQPSGSIKVLNGIRVLSMCWIILGHTYVLQTILAPIPTTANLAQALKNYRNYTFQTLLSAIYGVDTFFLLSGVLVSYLFLKQLDKIGKAGLKILKMMGLYYFHRYWRLTPLLAMVIYMYVSLAQYTGDGPLMPHPPPYLYSCKNNWWTNLLYINNVVKPEEMCLGWTWYLANDMQFYIISPLILFPLFFLPVLGYVIVSAVLIASVATTIVLLSEQEGYVMIQMDFINLYIKPWIRIGPYLFGLVVGYILFRTKFKICMNKIVVCIGWIVSIAFIYVPSYIQYDELHEGPTPWSREARIFYETTARLFWSLGLSWIILACSAGYGGVVTHILSWRAWVPLGRLTYAAYLLHPLVMDFYLFNSRSLLHATNINMAYLFCAHLSMTYGLSVLFSLVFEAPMMGLEKIFLPRNK